MLFEAYPAIHCKKCVLEKKIHLKKHSIYVHSKYMCSTYKTGRDL